MQQVYNLDTLYNLSEGQISEYRENGHILLRQLARPEEISFYRKEILDAVNKLNTEKRALKDRDTYGKAFLQIFNLWRTRETLKKFVLAKRFGTVAAQLMGVERVRIYHDQALFKEAGGGHTPWHQDQFYWPLDTDSTITMWMPLIDITWEMGIMQFVSGSHKSGYILSKEISDDSDNFFNQYIREKSLLVSENHHMKAGDATFHTGWTLHSAPSNKTSVMREVMTVIYFPDNTRVLKPDNPYRQNDLDTWLGGLAPGAIAKSELNPVV